MAKEIVSTHENPFLRILYKDRIQALASHPALTEKTDLTQDEQQSYVDVVISIQHMAAEIPHDEEKAKLFSDIFAESLDNMARKNILLPLSKEVVAEENQSFKTYITEILRIVKELDALKTQKLKPSAEKSSEYVSIIISFQRFLTQKYNQTENRTDYKYIEPSIAFLSSAIKALSIFNIKFPSEQLEFTTGKAEAIEKPTTPPAPVEAKPVIIERRLTENQLKEEKRQNEIIEALRKAKPGDTIQLLDLKGQLVETHTILKKIDGKDLISVRIENHLTSKIIERDRYFTHYTDINIAASVRVIEQIEKIKEDPSALFTREESRKKFAMDGSLLKAFEIGNQRFGIFKIYEDNRHCFLNQTNRFATTGTDFFICQFDEQLQTNSYKSKGLRPNESVTLGRDHLQNRFNYKEDDALSRTHVKIELLNGNPVITDLGSTNGTKELTKPEVLAPMPVITKTEDVNEDPEPEPMVSENVKEVIAKNQGAEIIGQNNELTLAQSIRKFRSKHGSEIAAGSDKGINYKAHNEDRVVVVPDKEFLAVIDGMGGYGGGDIAAQLVAHQLSQNPENIQLALQKASAAIDNAIKQDVISNGSAGAPFISARVIREHNKIELEYSYTGDCSLIVIDKSGRVKYVSETDSYLNSPRYLAVNNNIRLTDDQLLYHPQRNIVMKAIDRKHSQFTTKNIPMETGDRVILMSDGINDNLTPAELAQIVLNKTVNEAIIAVDQVTSTRMLNEDQIINSTPNRAQSGIFSDGYRSEPKKDNRGIAIIDIK